MYLLDTAYDCSAAELEMALSAEIQAFFLA